MFDAIKKSFSTSVNINVSDMSKKNFYLHHENFKVPNMRKFF